MSKSGTAMALQRTLSVWQLDFSEQVCHKRISGNSRALNRCLFTLFHKTFWFSWTHRYFWATQVSCQGQSSHPITHWSIDCWRQHCKGKIPLFCNAQECCRGTAHHLSTELLWDGNLIPAKGSNCSVWRRLKCPGRKAGLEHNQQSITCSQRSWKVVKKHFRTWMTVLVLDRIIFFLVAGMLPCFGFSIRMLLITHRCFNCS